MKNIIVSTYKNLGDSETVAFAHRVVEKMENNPTFPDAPAALGALKKLVPELLSAVGNARSRDNEPDAVITQLEVELGPPGEATVSIKRVRAARAYMHQFTNEPPSATTVWASAGSKQAYYTFSGLNSMAKYWFRVVAIGRYGEIITSPVVARVIQ